MASAWSRSTPAPCASPRGGNTRTPSASEWDGHGQPYLLARALGLFSTASKLMLKSMLAGYQDGERALLVRWLPHLADDDLLVMDRGFSAAWLFASLAQWGRGFLARMDGVNWPEVQTFVRSGRHDAVYDRRITPHTRRQASRKLGLEWSGNTLSFRLIRVVLFLGGCPKIVISTT